MCRAQKQPLRALRPQERRELARLVRSQRQPAAHVARARALLAVAAGMSFTAAAHAAGRRSGDGVAKLVARFNGLGLAAIAGRPASGRPPKYGERDRRRILDTARRTPNPVRDGTRTWSLATLRRALRRGGLPRVSTYTIRAVLLDAGVRFGRTRSWCPTGAAVRRRKHGTVVVVDPDAIAKKS
ncbi:MAG: helix-turn-helix domain-containing protein [Tepidisphaeraceae bacterium]